MIASGCVISSDDTGSDEYVESVQFPAREVVGRRGIRVEVSERPLGDRRRAFIVAETQPRIGQRARGRDRASAGRPGLFTNDWQDLFEHRHAFFVASESAERARAVDFEAKSWDGADGCSSDVLKVAVGVVERFGGGAFCERADDVGADQDGGGVAGAEDADAVFGGAFEPVESFVEFTGSLVAVAEVVVDRGPVAVVAVEAAGLGFAERLEEEGLGSLPVVAALRDVRAADGQADAEFDGDVVGIGLVDSGFGELVGAVHGVEEFHVEEGGGVALEDGRFEDGVVESVGGELLEGDGVEVFESRVGAESFVVERVEHGVHEVGSDLLCDGCLSGPFGIGGLDFESGVEFDGAENTCCGEQRGGDGDGELAALDEFLGSVDEARRAGEDRLAFEEAFEVFFEREGGGVASFAVFFEALGDDPVEVGGEGADEIVWFEAAVEGGLDGERVVAGGRADAGGHAGRGVFAEDSLDAGDAGPAHDLFVEGEFAGEEFVEDDAEGVDVGAGVDVVEGEVGLLGRHVVGRAHELALLGHQGLLVGAGGEGLGDAEVDDLGRGLVAVVGGDEDVGWFEVAVEDAACVCVVDGVADVDEEADALFDGELCGVGVGGDGGAADPLHDEVGLPGVGGAAAEDAGDVGVVHAFEGVAFGVEARQHSAGIHAGLDDLEGEAFAGRVEAFGEVDEAEAAFGHEVEDAVGVIDEFAGLVAKRARRTAGP